MAQDLKETIHLEREDDVALVDRMRDGRESIIREVRKLIVGQSEVVDQVLLTLFVGGNSLLLGVPGLAKTLLIHTVAEVLDLDFSRGPVFANIVLADEINRTPPKTQAALLEAMEEHRVTVQGTTYTLEEPFYVFATQNPIELEGTYPLPEAQLDRFMFEIVLDHLSLEEELEVVRETTGIQEPEFNRAVTGPDLVAFQRLVRRMPAPEPVLEYAVSLVRTSRPSPNGTSPEFVKKWIAYGASVRAAQYLVLGAKARALTTGRYTPGFDDIRALAHPVLRHRILTNFHAESEGKTTGELVDQLLETVPVPKSGM
jgi:MoxR-like ATPase